MGTRIGIISVIPKDFSQAFPTMERSLREKGLSMFPGTFKMMFPYKEISGLWRTGLDPNAAYIRNLNGDAKIAEQNRVTALRKDLESKTGLDLSPNSKYWETIYPVKLTDGDNTFDLENPLAAIAFAWLRVHPKIASSLEAYQRGDFLPDTHFYIKDKDVEDEMNYKKTKTVNDAVKKMDSYSLDKRKKLARLLGLPIAENSKEEYVYNELDKFLKQGAVKAGSYQGQDAVSVFNSLADLDDESIYIRDLVKQALDKNIFREDKAGRINEGATVRWGTKTEMVNFFLDPDNQLDVVELENRIKIKDLVK